MSSQILVTDSIPTAMISGSAQDISRAQRRRAEKEGAKIAKAGRLVGTSAVTYNALPRLLSNIFAPKLTALAEGVQETSLSYLALISLLIEKGVFTHEELAAAEENLNAKLNSPSATPPEASPDTAEPKENAACVN